MALVRPADTHVRNREVQRTASRASTGAEDQRVGIRPEIVGSNADAAVARHGQYVILLWRRNVVAEGVEWTRNAFARVVRGQPSQKIVFVTIVESACEIASSEVRKDVAELLKIYESQLACAAIVFEASGFRMTILRSFITAINMTNRARFPNAVFGKLDAALSWVATQRPTASVTADHPALREITQQLRTLPAS